MFGEKLAQGQDCSLSGNGGEGGGGICAARHLANRGADVRLCISAVERLKEVPQWQRHSSPGLSQ
ncbi:MAG: NAD(P)H-hydrate epimerase [Cyanobacteria bacterium P01_F01_bin.86]